MNNKLKLSIKLYKICIGPIITSKHQGWAAAKLHISKVQKIQNKFLKIILNKPYDMAIAKLHKIAKMPTQSTTS